ncbi:MAG: DUF87 domain-containing protein [Candidatus Thermoplasmatota archaeon]|jgi:DNA helicase HerA-like ATPase|nr:DUF87 domain-containing protein [Candidatus Thermoplasmatota archaeon]MCL5790080.1 DUF87 domain-containing protein [Candidatus Thermoplasmatota archaeon]
MITNPFDDERLRGARSALVRVTPDTQGRFSFELWCQYTRLGLDSLQIGDLVAIENYTPPTNGNNVYSVLTLSQIYPVHFAIQGKDAYPGHVFESMRSIREDWESQSERPLHLTTTIMAQAVSTGFQFRYNPRSTELPPFEEERNIPMTGAEIRPLSRAMVDAIINQGIRDEPDSPFNHKKFDNLNVKLNIESLLTTHFGIFGFTGVGKSNLVSSLVSALSSGNLGVSANIVLMDPNDEYLALLIDKFESAPDQVSYIHVGPESLATRIIQYLGDNGNNVPNEVIELMRQQLRLPPALQNVPNLTEYLRRALSNAIRRTRIVLPFEDIRTLIHEELQNQTDERTGPAAREALRNVERNWSDGFEGTPITSENVKRAIDAANAFPSPFAQPFQHINDATKGTAKGVIDRTLRELDRIQRGLINIPPSAIIPIGDLIQSLNSRERHQTIIITGRKDSELKHFASVLGNQLYDSRRQMTSREPFISFVFDEADLFLPQDRQDADTVAIRELCITLARRGRKFGLGIGISTQRASLLDTAVMANLHTYFVSKLPRLSDRQRVSEAFGISEEQLAPTFTFRPGNWLIISHDATGLKGVPIPTIAEDANQRILRNAGISEQH